MAVAMNREQFERLKARFGDQIVSWPAPYLQEAMLFLESEGSGTSDDDERLDRLVLEAILVPTDERGLSRKVMRQITQLTPARLGHPFALRHWSFTATATGLALILAVAAVGGFLVGGTDAELSDNALLALATGEPPTGLLDVAPTTAGDGGRL